MMEVISSLKCLFCFDFPTLRRGIHECIIDDMHILRSFGTLVVHDLQKLCDAYVRSNIDLNVRGTSLGQCNS